MEPKIEIFRCPEWAFDADLREGSLTKQQFASLMWPNRMPDVANNYLSQKLSLDRKPDLSITEYINGLKIIGKSENSVRFFCNELGYNMPTRQNPDDEKIAEEEIKIIDHNIERLSDELHKQTSLRKEAVAKIKRVPVKCTTD